MLQTYCSISKTVQGKKIASAGSKSGKDILYPKLVVPGIIQQQF